MNTDITVVPRTHRTRAPFVARALLAAAAGALTVGLLSAAPAPVAAPAQAAPCPDIEVIFARGTTEDPGVGRVGNSFIQDLRGMVGGRSVGAYGVNYPADYDFMQAAAGANDASAHVQWMMNNCPATRLVLGGYSPGAAVIDTIAAVPVPGLGFDNPLPPNAPEHVAAIAVFGNPSAKLGLPLTSSPVWGARSIDLCIPGDPVCNLGLFEATDVEAHRAYPGGATQQAAGFVAGRL